MPNDTTIFRVFPVHDDADPEQTVWFALERSPYGLWVTVYKEQPTADTVDTDAMLITKVDFFDNQLANLAWDNKTREIDRDDPHKDLWVEDVRSWIKTVDES